MTTVNGEYPHSCVDLSPTVNVVPDVNGRLDKCQCGAQSAHMATVTGPELRKERRASEITVTEIALRMSLSRQTIHALEKDCEPDQERVIAYREALYAARDDRETA